MRDYASVGGACQDNTRGLLAYLNFDIRENPVDPVEAVTFCDEALDQWTDELRQLHQLHFARGDYISTVELLSMGLNIMHELSHSQQVLGKNSYGTLDLSSCLMIRLTLPPEDVEYSQGMNSAAYGWAAVLDLARTPDAARNNADSFAFFAAGEFVWNKRPGTSR